jgi:hypothetical protein
LHGEHEVGLAVAVEVGLAVLALLAGRERDVDAEVVDRAEALLALGGELDAVALELAAVELPWGSRCRRGRRVDGALVDGDGEREPIDLRAARAAARAGDREAVAQRLSPTTGSTCV